MKNQKFFFSVIAVLLVLGVFALFFFGFKSRVFAKVGVVGLVSEQVTVVDRGVVSGAVGRDVIVGVTDKVDAVAVNAVVNNVQLVKTVAVQSEVDRVGKVVNDVPITLVVERQHAIV